MFHSVFSTARKIIVAKYIKPLTDPSPGRYKPQLLNEDDIIFQVAAGNQGRSAKFSFMILFEGAPFEGALVRVVV